MTSVDRSNSYTLEAVCRRLGWSLKRTFELIAVVEVAVGAASVGSSMAIYF